VVGDLVSGSELNDLSDSTSPVKLRLSSTPAVASRQTKFVVEAETSAPDAPAVASLDADADNSHGTPVLATAEVEDPRPGAEDSQLFASDCPAPAAETWRAEVAARLDRYRSRRKPRAPRYPSLRLKFEAPAPAWSESAANTASLPHPHPNTALATAVALAPMLPEPVEVAPPTRQQIHTQEEPVSPVPEQESETSSAIGKIIEFPRFGWPPPPQGDELAEAVITHPRILDVPEIAPPPPAMGGILMEAQAVEQEEKRPGIDVPLQSAPIEKRMLATAIDGLLVLSATALFASIVFRLAHPQLPLLQTAGTSAGLAAIFWACYQYGFLVYTGSTPGLRSTKLRLSRFDGRPVNQNLRRWRVLVSFLSAASLGMGYAWHFLDEDALCWHDRMTHTYIGPDDSAVAL
jgi:uncharacterized RDD family membrane protein YckC